MKIALGIPGFALTIAAAASVGVDDGRAVLCALLVLYGALRLVADVAESFY